jgi:hypothetical protein
MIMGLEELEKLEELGVLTSQKNKKPGLGPGNNC